MAIGNSVLNGGCDCDAPPSPIENPDGCKIMELPKVVRMVFQRGLDTNNFVTAVNPIEASTSWTGLADAVDDTQIWTTPKLTDVDFGATAVVDGSENADGAPTVNGVETQLVVAKIKNINPSVAKAINGLRCLDNISVYFVYNNNSISSTIAVETPEENIGSLLSEDTFSGSAPERVGTGASPEAMYTFQFRLPATWFEDSTNTKAEAGFSYINDLLPA